MFSKLKRCLSVRFSCTTSSSARWRAIAVRMSASSFSLSHGFCTKFSAPARIASTTLPTVPKAVIMMTGRFGCVSVIRGSRSIPFSPGSARSSRSRSYSLRDTSSIPVVPSPAMLTVNPSSVSSASSDSRIAASSSMMRIRGLPATCAIRCRCRVSAAISVVSDMHRLPLKFRLVVRARLRSDRWPGAGGRELQLERGSHSELALYMDLAGVLLHDSVGDSESESGALVGTLVRLRLGGKEWIVDTVEVLPLDSCTRILDANEHPARSAERRDPERCTRRSEHRVLRVQHQVQDYLLQLATIPMNARKLRIQVCFDANLSRLELVLQQRNRIVEKFVEVDAGKLRSAGAGEVEQAVHNLRSAEGLLRDLLEHGCKTFIIAHMFREHLRIAGDDGQRRVDLMRDAGSQQA